MERSMKEIGVIIFVKVKVHRKNLQVMSMWVSGKKVNKMEEVNIHGQMDKSMKEIGVIIFVKAKEE